MVNYCVCAGCKNSNKTGHRVHSFPKDKGIFRRWVKFVMVRRADFSASSVTANSTICSAHFKKDDYHPGDAKMVSLGLKSERMAKLLPTAVPSVHANLSGCPVPRSRDTVCRKTEIAPSSRFKSLHLQGILLEGTVLTVTPKMATRQASGEKKRASAKERLANHRAAIYSDPNKLEEYRRNARERYRKRKEAGKLKTTRDLSSRQHERKKKQWRSNSAKYYKKKKQEKALLDITPKSCLKFLHTNSTSHTGPFSAIAELIDNAYDPDVNAKQIWIDKTQIKDKDCLTFMDNGNGLDWYKMHRMLSFGYSDKKGVAGLLPIGMYGNGFKSGSMRLGQDVIIFSKSEKDLCVGMLSQSYLKETGAECITVPIISIKEPRDRGLRVLEEHRASLKVILDHSPFNTEEELLTELQAIESTGSTTGTRIIIWNLRRTSTGNVEFDFTTDRYDIRIPCDVFDSEAEACQSSERSDSSVPESGFSLRAYCSILYMKPRMQIIIRGQKVKTQLISKSLTHIAKDIYKPSFLKQKIPIIFGYNTKSKEQYGIMMYHKNRLIKAYLRVGCQLNATNRQGIGVIGVIECNFLKPIHNKQDFDYTDNYRNAIRNVATKLEEYCKEMQFKRKKNNPSNDMLIEETEKRPDQNWAQCDGCQQWRRLPDGIDPETLPEEWFCSMNPDPQFRLCETKEEPEDSDSEQPTYPKTYKIHEREEKKKQDKMKELKKEASSMNTPQTPEQGSSASTVAPGDLVITEVFSLSKSPSRMKRRQPLTPQSQSKRPTVSSVRRTLDTYLSSFTSPLTPVPRDDVNHDHDLREGSRAPVLKEPTICTASGSLASLEVRSTGNDATEMRDTTTKIQGPRVKEEEEEMDISTAANDGATVKKEGSLDINQAQEQQDQLMELLHTVSSERDSFKEMINKLQAQLMEEKQRPDSQAQYKLYEQAEKKAEELSRENEALLQAHAKVLQQNQEQAKQIEVLTNRCNEMERLSFELAKERQHFC